MEEQFGKIIITRRIWQLLAAAGVVLLAVLATPCYSLNARYGLWIGGRIFFVVFALAYWREERRATRSPDSNLVINWNLAEAVLFLASILGYFILAYVLRFGRDVFYAYLHTGALGLLGGVALGEWLWQNTKLRELDETCRQRYWANYKDSIF
ncbi:MAG: hypothetical protein HY210_09075 [Candidatus Omnitrophica bacterium]|nr:hypothetical protein [Candidatus Omnitrophota bacterium]